MTLALIDGDFLLHSAMWETKTVDQFIERIDRSLTEWTDSAFCDEYIMALGPWDGMNYRNDLFDGYKKSVSREKQRKVKPAHFADAKKYLYDLPGVVVGDNIEADDLLGHWAMQDEDSVIVSADKDLNQIPGAHYTPHYMRPHLYTVSEKEARAFFRRQMLTGDSIDNIIGIRGVGPKRADALLEEFDEDVIEIYKSKYEDEWKDWFLSNGKLLYIQREADRQFTVDLYEEMFT